MYAFFYLIDRILYPIRRIGYYAGRILPGVSRLASASPALQAALVTFLFLFVASLAATIFQYQIYSEFDEVVGKKLLIYFVMIVAIPIGLYFGIKLWMTPTQSAYPDIDDAWREGIGALEDQGMALKNFPLFLVLGGASSTRLSATFRGSGMPLLLDGVSRGAAPLRWYATEEAIYLCCTTLGVFARLVELAGEDSRYPVPVAGDSSDRSPTGTATAFPDEIDAAESPLGVIAFTPPTQMRGMPGRTIDLQDVLGDSSTFKQSAYDPSSSRDVGLTSADTREQRERLAYLCKLLRAARDPVCPVNGLLILAPFQTVLEASNQTEAALQDDLGVLRAGLQIRCASIVLVTDMEREPGFLELIRRVGSQLAVSARFGRGFDHRTCPTKERLEALVQHACGAFEDWTYKLFAQPGALEKPSNGQLFATMCKVRGRFRRAFTSTLANGFGCEREEEGSETLMFGGCYFAATGEESGSSGFVRAVFDKLSQFEDDLEWMDTAIQRNERCRAAANLILLTGVAALIAAAVLWWQTSEPPAVADRSPRNHSWLQAQSDTNRFIAIEISDSSYQKLVEVHGDVTAYVEKLAVEADEIAAVQEGIAAYQAGDQRPHEEFAAEFMAARGIQPKR